MSRRRRFIVRRIVWFLILLVVGIWLASLVAVVVWQRRDTARPAEAIVVLGAAQYAGHPSPVLRARLDHALALYERGLAPRLIVTGGRGNGDTTSEAEVSRRYVERRGVPDSAVLIEPNGRTTEESMIGVAALMRRQPSRDVILVSDPFHMLRLAIIARQLGLRPYLSPTRTSPISASRALSERYILGESVKVPFALMFGTQ